MIDKYKYKWLENANTQEYYDPIIRFFNENKPREYIEIRLRGDKKSGYLINGIKKKKQEIKKPNIETFLIKFPPLSKEEKIGRSFSNYYTMRDSKFIFSILSASTSYTFNISVLFSKDENFIRSLEAAKEEFDKLYLAIKNPYEYSLEALISKDLWEIACRRGKDDKF